MREGVGKVWLAPCAALIFIGALSAACSTRDSSDVARSGSAADVDVQPHRSDGTASDVASIVGTWEFAALTGVPPAELPPGSVPDNRRDVPLLDPSPWAPCQNRDDPLGAASRSERQPALDGTWGRHLSPSASRIHPTVSVARSPQRTVANVRPCTHGVCRNWASPAVRAGHGI